MRDADGHEIAIDTFEPSEADKEFLRRWSTPSDQIAKRVKFVTENGYEMNADELEYLRSKWM